MTLHADFSDGDTNVSVRWNKIWVCLRFALARSFITPLPRYTVNVGQSAWRKCYQILWTLSFKEVAGLL